MFMKIEPQRSVTRELPMINVRLEPRVASQQR